MSDYRSIGRIIPSPNLLPFVSTRDPFMFSRAPLTPGPSTSFACPPLASQALWLVVAPVPPPGTRGMYCPCIATRRWRRCHSVNRVFSTRQRQKRVMAEDLQSSSNTSIFPVPGIATEYVFSFLEFISFYFYFYYFSLLARAESPSFKFETPTG